MSPHLRSMLEDAADDSGRPGSLDLNAVRAGGRRAVWRQRAIVGAVGISATAVVTAVVVSVGGSGEPLGVVGPQSTPSPVPASAAASTGTALLNPLFDALSASGYDVDANGTGMSGVSSSGSGGSGAGSSTMSMTYFPITKDDTVGVLAVAEFSDVAMLASMSGESPPEQQCAVLPGEASGADFAWTSCDKSESDDAEVWRATGSGTGGDGFGVTVVRLDGSGLSITMSEALYGAYSLADFGHEPMPTAVAISALDQLPLGEDTFTELVMLIAAGKDGSVFGTPSSGEELVDVPTMPDTCPEDSVIAEMSDDAGRSMLLQADDVTYVCTVGGDLESILDIMDVTSWPPFEEPLEPWHFNLGYVSSCSSIGGCGDEVRLGVGRLPDGVARITFETAAGEILDAQIAQGVWMFRYLETVTQLGEAPPLIVRAYDSTGTLLVEGDVNEVNSGAPATSDMPTPPPPSP